MKKINWLDEKHVALALLEGCLNARNEAEKRGDMKEVHIQELLMDIAIIRLYPLRPRPMMQVPVINPAGELIWMDANKVPQF